MLSDIIAAMGVGKVVYYVIPENEGSIFPGTWTVCGFADSGNKTVAIIERTITQFSNSSGYPSKSDK